jgi:release factor glutamine methyltransferase
VTYHDAALRGRTLLIEAGILPETATLDADLLARHTLAWDLATWIARRGETADAPFTEAFTELIRRRSAREPVAYIRGVQEFWGRAFSVSPAVLIPRPETELLIEVVLRQPEVSGHVDVIDVGTGSGCIAITLALELRDASVLAIDISSEALAMARANARQLGATSRVTFVQGDMLAEVTRPVDLVVSNPPYVAARDRAALGEEVRGYEPATALFGGDDGWRDIRTLLATAPRALKSGGLLVMELGFGQSERLRDEIQPGDLALEDIAEDLQGIPRVAVFRRR